MEDFAERLEALERKAKNEVSDPVARPPDPRPPMRLVKDDQEREEDPGSGAEDST
jgi:hypothetical protein